MSIVHVLAGGVAGLVAMLVGVLLVFQWGITSTRVWLGITLAIFAVLVVPAYFLAEWAT